MKKVAIAGVSGRMGRALLAALCNTHYELKLGAAVHKSGGKWVGKNSRDIHDGSSGVPVTGSLECTQFDILIDFSLPASALANIEYCSAKRKPVVIGATGFDGEQLERISSLAMNIPIVLAPNMSVGVNLCLHLLKQAADVLQDSVDIEITETHHRNKLDAPSGTALVMGQVIADTLGRDLSDVAAYGREGAGDVRSRKTIGFSSIRAGDVVGDHTVMFAGEGERIELTHKASDRSIYANGALRAADWISEQQAGLYSMQHVLGLS